jgi:hypothetical protein
MSPDEVVARQLPKSMSEKRRNELVEQILDALAEWGYLVEGVCTTVSTERALVPVETVEVYGLTIALDANGDASEISHRDGLVVLE